MYPRGHEGGLLAALVINRTCTAQPLQQAVGPFCRERFLACPEMLETDGRQAEADLFNLEDPFWISIVDQCHFRYAQSTHMPVMWPLLHVQDLNMWMAPCQCMNLLQAVWLQQGGKVASEGAQHLQICPPADL